MPPENIRFSVFRGYKNGLIEVRIYLKPLLFWLGIFPEHGVHRNCWVRTIAYTINVQKGKWQEPGKVSYKKKTNINFTKLSEKNWQGCRTLGEKFTKQFVLLLNTGLTKNRQENCSPLYQVKRWTTYEALLALLVTSLHDDSKTLEKL